MLVIMQQDSTVEQCAKVEDVIRDMGYEPLPVPGESRTAICVTGNKGPVDPSHLQRLAGVRECVSVTRPYKLVSREVKPCLLYTSPSPRDATLSRMPSSA